MASFENSLPGLLLQFFSMSEWLILVVRGTLFLSIAWLLHFVLALANPRRRVLLWRTAAVGIVGMVFAFFTVPNWRISISLDHSVVQDARLIDSSPVPFDGAGLTADALRENSFSGRRLPVESKANDSGLELAGDRERISEADASMVQRKTVRGIERSSANANRLIPVTNTIHKERRPTDVRTTDSLWFPLAIGVWSCVVLLQFLRVILAHLQLRRIVLATTGVDESIEKKMKRMAAEMGLRRVPAIRRSRTTRVPFVCGIGAPLIILPHAMCEPTYKSHLPAILAHELGHLRSSDIVWTRVVQQFSIFFWFHPLVWRIGSAHKAACDAVCDAEAASYVRDTASYCRTLARVALDSHAFRNPAVLMMARMCDVRRRIAALQRRSNATRLTQAAVGGSLLIGLSGLVFLASVRFTPADANEFSEERILVRASGLNPLATRSMRVRIVDELGQPIRNAVVFASSKHWKFEFRLDGERTNAKGIARIDYPNHREVGWELLVLAQGRASVQVRFPPSMEHQLLVEESVPPDNLQLTLREAATIGGRVITADGKPIAGAKVKISGQMKSPKDYLEFSFNETRTTDFDGNWRCNHAPENLAELQPVIKLEHESYAQTLDFRYHDQGLPLNESHVNDLQDQTLQLFMHKPIVVRGRVVDEAGELVVGAEFTLAGDGVSYHGQMMSPNGVHTVWNARPGTYKLIVAHKDFVSHSRNIDVLGDSDIHDVTLRRGDPIVVRVVDEQRKPILGARIVNEMDEAGYRRSDDRTGAQYTDKDGRWRKQWHRDEKLTCIVGKPGYTTVKFDCLPDPVERVVMLQPGGKCQVSGTVTDAETNAPVSDFRVVWGNAAFENPQRIGWRDWGTATITDGAYQATLNNDTVSTLRGPHVRIEADGYLPSHAQLIQPDDVKVEFHVELMKGENITGSVVSPSGQPLAGADVCLITANRWLYLRAGRVDRSQYQIVEKTDEVGRFRHFPPGEEFHLMVLHDEGFAKVEDFSNGAEIQIQPWARVEGELISRGRSLSKDVSLEHEMGWRFGEDGPMRIVDHPNHAKIDEHGKFVFERVFPGKGRITRGVIFWKDGTSGTFSTFARFSSGETTVVRLGDVGQTVVGRLVLPDGRRTFDWSRVHVSIAALTFTEPLSRGQLADRIRLTPVIRDQLIGRRINETTMQEVTAARSRWHSADFSPIYVASVDRNGEFRYEKLPAGRYQLVIHGFTMGDNERMFGRFVGAFALEEMTNGDTDRVVDLGELRLDAVSK